MKIRGRTTTAIASALDVTERTVFKAWEEFKELAAQEFAAEDPEDAVWQALLEYDGLKTELYDVLETTVSSMNLSAKVGAARAIGEMLERQLELRQATGRLPKNLGELAVKIDLRHVETQVIAVLRNHGASRELLEDLRNALGGGTDEARVSARRRVIEAAQD